MLKLIKKYRSNPKRIVVTFSFQKKFILNRLGDLMQKNDREMVEEYKGIELEEIGYACKRNVDGCGEEYVLENEHQSECESKNNPLKEKRKQIEIEQAQILEKDGCTRAFKENYHIKPIEFEQSKGKSPCKKALETERDMRGGIVCEKSFKMLLCDLVVGVGMLIFLFCLLGRLKRTKR